MQEKGTGKVVSATATPQVCALGKKYVPGMPGVGFWFPVFASGAAALIPDPHVCQ